MKWEGLDVDIQIDFHTFSHAISWGFEYRLQKKSFKLVTWPSKIFLVDEKATEFHVSFEQLLCMPRSEILISQKRLKHASTSQYLSIVVSLMKYENYFNYAPRSAKSVCVWRIINKLLELSHQSQQIKVLFLKPQSTTRWMCNVVHK